MSRALGMRVTRRRLGAIGAAGAALGGAACGMGAPATAGSDGGAAPKKGGTLTRAMTAEPTQIDPQGAANSGTNLVLPYVFDTLVVRKKDGSFAPHLAESWQTTPDGKTVEMKLKRGVTFHDGSKMDAAAVVFTFERFKQVGAQSPIWSGVQAISRVEAVGEEAVRFHFDEPTATIWSTLAMPYSAILSPGAMRAADAGTRPVGTGPFTWGEWKRGVGITLRRNPAYAWGPPEAKNKGAVHLDTFDLKLIPDASTQFAALQAGEVDVLFINDPGHLARTEGDKSLRLERVNLDALIYLGFNCAKAPFNEVKVRQALSHAVNKADVVKTALGGLGDEAHTPLVPSMLGYDAGLKSHGQDFNLSRARALLAEAGFSQGADGAWQRGGQRLAARLLTSNRAPNEAVATVLQSQLKALGVAVDIQQLDSAAVMRATTEGAFDLLLWRYDWNDPDALNIYLGGSRVRSTNRVFYANPEVDGLLARGAQEMDQKKRADLYKDAQKVILRDAPWQPLYTPVEALAVRDRVKGMTIGSLGRMLLNDVTISG